MSEIESRTKRKTRPSFVWPIMLITVGVIFLLSNLGLVKDDFLIIIWRIWPVIFIIIGLDSLLRRNEIAGPVFMIGLGLIILLSSIGWVGWRFWDILWRLWPILSTISHPLGEIDDADVSISPVVGELTIDGFVDTNTLITGKLNDDGSQGVYSDYSVSSKSGIFSIDSRSFINFPGTQSWDWDFSLTDQIPLALDLEMGVGDMSVDLSNLILQSLEINQAIGELNLTLAEGDDYRAELSQAIGSIIIELPEDCGVRIEISRAISTLSLPSSFEHRGGYYYSSNYDTSDFKIDLEVNQAIGSIEIR